MFTLLFWQCEDKVSKFDNWPEWPSRPIIEQAQLRGLNDETTVAAGDKVRFTAQVNDDYNDLISYQLEFRSGGIVIDGENGTLSGSQADIDFETILPFGPYYEDGYTEVILKVTNTVNGTAEVRLSNEKNVRVTRPETPDQLHIVDNTGAVYTLPRIGNTYIFQTSGELESLGSTFKIAEKLKGDQIDYTGLVWGMADGNIAIVNDASASSIRLPETGGYNIKHMRFDMYSFNLSKTVDLRIEIKKSDMELVTKGGTDYLIKDNIPLVQDCEVKFTGFDQELAAMLRPDLFTDLSGDVARFIGDTRDWRAFYQVENGFMYVHTFNNEENLLWVTGTGGGFPLPPYTATLDWFGTEPHGYFSCVRTGDDTYEIAIYLAADFTLQTYRMVAWGAVVNWHSVTPDLLTVRSNNDGIAGPDFTPGVYKLRVNVSTGEAALTPYH